MSIVNWATGVGGNWSTGARWSGGATPKAGDDATIAAAGTYTVSVTSHDVAGSLTFNAAGATLAESAAGSLNVAGAVNLVAGTMSLAGANTIGAFSQSGGVLQLANAGALGANALTLTGGEVTGTATETIGNYLLLGGSGFTLDAAAGQSVNLGGGGWLLDRSASPVIQFGSATRTGTVLWHAATGGINGMGAYQVNIAGGTLEAADGGMGYFLGNASQTTIQAGATLDINGASTAITGLFGGGRIVDSGAAAILQLKGGLFDGVISGGMAVDVTQNILLRGVNTYTGATFIDPGASLVFLGSGSVAGAIVDSGYLVNEDSAPLTLGPISGSGIVAQQGPDNPAMTLNDADTYTGGTQITTGTVFIGSGAAIGTGAVTIYGGELVGTRTLTMTNSLTVGGVTSLAAAAGTTFTITGGSGLTFDAQPGPLNLTFGDAVNTGTVAVTSTSETVNHAFPIHIAVAGGTLKTPDDSLALVAANATDFTIAAGAALDLDGVSLETVALSSAGTITNSSATAATLETTQTSTATGLISGNIAVWVLNGSLTLAGVDTYTGGTRIVAGATLQLGTGFSASSIVGPVQDDGAFLIVDNTATNLTGAISGAGSLVSYGSGAISLGAANSYAGGTTLNNGELKLAGGLALGTGNVTLNGGELLATTTMSLAATQTAANLFALSGADTIAAAHATTLNVGGAQLSVGAGTLHIGEGANDGTVVFTGGASTVSGPFAVDVDAGTLRNGDIAFGNVMSSATGVNVASGAAWDLAGFGAEAAILTGAGTVTDSKTKAVLFDFGGQFDGVISGKITLSAANATLTGADTYTGGTVIDDGTLTLGAGGTTGSILGGVVDGGVLAIDHANAVNLTNAISGTGTVLQEGIGVTTLSGANSYTGGTTVTVGELTVAAAAALGKGGTVTLSGGELLTIATMALSHNFRFDGGVIAAAHGTILTMAAASDTADAGTMVFGQGANDGTIVFKSTAGVGFTAPASTFVEVQAGLLRAGDLSLGSLLGAASGTRIDAGAAVDAAGHQLVIEALTGTGSLTNSGGAAALTLFGSTNFGGVISGKFSTIDIQLGSATLGGNETFVGTVRIDGSNLTLSGKFAETVAFNGGGTLTLTTPANFTGAVSGFAAGAFIDLANITTGAAALLSYSAATHTLSVSDGVHADQIKLSGAYVTGNFVASADLAGGTTIGWRAAPAAPAFVQAMAGLGAATAPGASLVSTGLAHQQPATLATVH